MSDPAWIDLLGRSAVLHLKRFGSPGAFLAQPGDDADDAPVLLLLGKEIPEGAKLGDPIEVFIALDSEGRPIATTRTPLLERGDVGFLSVTATTSFGAFVDWGLAKDLLVPFAEQTRDLAVGDRQAFGVYLDDDDERGIRLCATMKVREALRPGRFSAGEWVRGEAWREEGNLGLFVIIERRHLGLLPRDEPHDLQPGAAAEFRITRVLPDGKIELSRRRPAHEELAADAERICEVLSSQPTLRVSDRMSPDEIRDTFSLSKKAFKRAIGRLLADRRVQLDTEGTVRLVAPPRAGSAKRGTGRTPRPAQR